jgi:Fe2+ transport system protein FeoA
VGRGAFYVDKLIKIVKEGKMRLKDCEIGKNIVVEDIELNDDICFRLKEIGITEGVNLKVCKTCSFDSKVISKGAERIGIDAKIANAIKVRYEDEVTS